MEFKDRLAQLRKDRNFSQSELAKRLNIAPATIGMYESGKRRPRPETEEMIADFFNVDLNYLRGIKDETTSCIMPDEVEIHRIYQVLSQDKRKELLNFAIFLEGRVS